MKKKVSKLVAGLLGIAMLSTTCFAANSIMPRDVEYMSKERETTYKGVAYTAYSSVYVGDDYRAGIWVISDTELTEGVMDARAILYSEDGDVLADTGWKENEAGLKFHYAVTRNRSSSDVVVAYGEYKVYSASGQMLEETSYVDSTGGKFENFSTRAVGNAVYGETEAGETYGSLMQVNQVGYAPELISAIGTDGTKGYVKKTDFDPDFYTLAARKAYTEALKEDNTIPLYDLNGNVIGEYEMGVPSDKPETDPLILEKIRQLTEQTSSEAVKAAAEETEVQTPAYDVTESGETYGKLPDAKKIGYYPDLVSVVGENGIKGYVYSENFEVRNVPEEGLTVPVYDLSGAVVDEFTFRCCNNWSGIRFPK